MSPAPEVQVYQAGLVLLAAAIVALSLASLVFALQRSRPGFPLGLAIATGLIIRVAATIAIALLAPGARGGDEKVFLNDARGLVGTPLLELDVDALPPLHVWLFSLELRLGFSEPGMRLIQIGIALSGLALLACAVYDLAGPRAARIAVWLLALEPASAFFGGLLHKEALMTLAAGIVALGGVRFWKGNEASGLFLLAAGCLVATATRPYAGWFLSIGAGALVVHRGLLTRGRSQRRSLAVTGLAVAITVLAFPLLKSASSPQRLERLQASQEANTTDQSNLALDPVTYRSRQDLVTSLPGRITDVLLRPYPWQLSSANQRLGFLGNLAAIVTLAFLLTTLIRQAGTIMSRAAPLVYPGFCLLAGYALTSGNAGTSFRHRAQLVALGLCVVLVLRETWRERWADRQLRPASSSAAPAAR